MVQRRLLAAMVLTMAAYHMHEATMHRPGLSLIMLASLQGQASLCML